MFVVGLTGGIGSGKSTLAALLVERGAHVIDADLLGRDALRPGQPAWHSVVAQFGDEILVPGSMEIDRKRLAAIVFSNRERLAALNAIVHPVIFKGIADSLERLRGSDAIVVLDAALILETRLRAVVNAIVVVDTNDENRRRRLIRTRGMSIADMQSRMSAQSTRDELLEAATTVVRNDGTVEDLAVEADRVWAELCKLKEKGTASGEAGAGSGVAES
jgi:dephospho-CoA kinase